MGFRIRRRQMGTGHQRRYRENKGTGTGQEDDQEDCVVWLKIIINKRGNHHCGKHRNKLREVAKRLLLEKKADVIIGYEKAPFR